MHSHVRSAFGPVQQRAYAAHELLDDAVRTMPRAGTATLSGLRQVVRESWERSMSLVPDPEDALARVDLVDEELEEYRLSHPLAAIMPVIHRLLVLPSHDTGMLVAVGDENGRLLWVDGDARLKSQAEKMTFIAGADWSEGTVGTSAPGTALALGRGVQISGAEHFSRIVHPWSCTAVPVRDPDSGAVLGVVDITGREEAVAPHTLSLVQATVAAAEAQLRIERLQRGQAQPTATAKPLRKVQAAGRTPRPRLYSNTLSITGRDQGQLSLEGHVLDLSLRHTEILTLLALHPRGLTADALADLLYPDAQSTTLRAEMVRLRKLIGSANPDAVPQSRPYRLPQELILDARQVLNYLQRGAHRLALNIYQGALLPNSEAPGIVRFREEVSANLREAVLSDASAETLLRYLQLPETEYDAEAWLRALRVLPARSPRRTAVVAHLERLEAELR
ncbi:GAF domain-containing protein [Arthrobacter crystallopoietes]|uniref:GAF domain-containing protein n=1 Tax=Crystallibacter crystallopoietes TaxID=37928 RepID=A0A1H1H7K3_9MICC|nr:GAF domain-containing protein [Arthrobacter crystallopoietes]AUI52099.1 transcriptional regulator [Arthrobacter crystallopoietes]SDQ23890.1 GAF domain-containing protein [Arthrobacter crystallopoietes]SDR21331.1 GAF domain-containing protein [Arthrobacter crystallopoietes]